MMAGIPIHFSIRIAQIQPSRHGPSYTAINHLSRETRFDFDWLNLAPHPAPRRRTHRHETDQLTRTRWHVTKSEPPVVVSPGLEDLEVILHPTRAGLFGSNHDFLVRAGPSAVFENPFNAAPRLEHDLARPGQFFFGDFSVALFVHRHDPRSWQSSREREPTLRIGLDQEIISRTDPFESSFSQVEVTGSQQGNLGLGDALTFLRDD